MNAPAMNRLSENKEFLYAIVLILLIPAAFIINTYILIQRVGGDFETEITGKARLGPDRAHG